MPNERQKPCPFCKVGVLVRRKGDYGEFFGCSAYPSCAYTAKIVVSDKKAGKPDTKRLEKMADAILQADAEKRKREAMPDLEALAEKFGAERRGKGRKNDGRNDRKRL